MTMAVGDNSYTDYDGADQKPPRFPASRPPMA